MEKYFNLSEKIDDAGASLRDGLSKLADNFSIAVQTTGIGSFFDIYFTKKPLNTFTDRKYADQRLRWFFDICLLNRGVYLAPGHCSYTCALTSKQDVKNTLESMEQTLQVMKPIIQEISPSLII